MLQDLGGAGLREFVPQDAEQLKGLWCDVFGDPPELVDAFSLSCPGWAAAVWRSATGAFSARRI